MLPSDPIMLLSFVNMKLRDQYASLDALCEDMDVSNYSVDAATLMEYINIINGWTLALAEDEALYYLNTVEVLVNDRGFLLDEYDVGDGHHLTSAAYLRMLEYIRTHGVTEGL